MRSTFSAVNLAQLERYSSTSWSHTSTKPSRQNNPQKHVKYAQNCHDQKKLCTEKWNSDYFPLIWFLRYIKKEIDSRSWRCPVFFFWLGQWCSLHCSWCFPCILWSFVWLQRLASQNKAFLRNSATRKKSQHLKGTSQKKTVYMHYDTMQTCYT